MSAAEPFLASATNGSRWQWWEIYWYSCRHISLLITRNKRFICEFWIFGVHQTRLQVVRSRESLLWQLKNSWGVVSCLSLNVVPLPAAACVVRVQRALKQDWRW
jgi:hypothetical protein